MQQVLFWIPVFDAPIYGYGAMLFAAFVACTWLASKLAEREGIPPQPISDLAMWIFPFGLLGARLTYIWQNWATFKSFWQCFAIWDGGLVFYGCLPGGAVGYYLAYHFTLRKYTTQLKLLDIIAPCVPLGLCLGRIGCLLNGCCYGNVAPEGCPAITFPLAAAPRFVFTERGLQTAAGFTVVDENEAIIDRVEPGSWAETAGLKTRDRIVSVNGLGVRDYKDLVQHLVNGWPRGKNDLDLTVQRGADTIPLPTFAPRTRGLHPTQPYESISMFFLMLVLLAYYPLKKHDGSLFAMFLVMYAIHRFLNEMLRTDTPKVAFDMTLSQNISIVMALIGLALAVCIGSFGGRRPAASA